MTIWMHCTNMAVQGSCVRCSVGQQQPCVAATPDCNTRCVSQGWCPGHNVNIMHSYRLCLSPAMQGAMCLIRDCWGRNFTELLCVRASHVLCGLDALSRHHRLHHASLCGLGWWVLLLTRVLRRWIHSCCQTGRRCLLEPEAQHIHIRALQQQTHHAKRCVHSPQNSGYGLQAPVCKTL